MSHHNTYDQDTINRVVASLRVENRSMICDMLIQTADRAKAAEQERDALRAECEEWRENYAALEAVAIASERERQAAEETAGALRVECRALARKIVFLEKDNAAIKEKFIAQGIAAANLRLALRVIDEMYATGTLPQQFAGHRAFDAVHDWLTQQPEVQP